MNIESILPNELFTEELILKLKTKKIHLVCPAISHQSYCVDYLALHLNMSINDVKRYCDIVNDKREPGCLYPTYSVTLFPYALETDLVYCMHEVFKAQEEYFKTSEMLIAFDTVYWHDKTELKTILQAFLDDLDKEAYLQKVYFLE